MSDYPMLISNKLHSFRNFALQKYEKQRKHTKEKLQVRRPHIPHNHNHNRAPPPTATLTPTPTAPASPGICELRPVPPARTPKTPATNTETPATNTETPTPPCRTKRGLRQPETLFTPDGPEAVPVNIEIPYPRNESRIPAATAEPTTPATLGPMACISR